MKEIVPPEMSEETEELPGEDQYSPLDPSWAKVFYEHVKCPSPAKTGEEYDLVGMWKLILQINGTDTVDCSCEDVVYHFKPDQMLTVSIGDKTEEDVAYEYDWGYPFCPLCLPLNPRPNLRMGSLEVYCWALPEVMFLYPQFKEVYVKVDPEREVVALVPLHAIKWIFVRID
jgi:hypothetical protein